MELNVSLVRRAYPTAKLVATENSFHVEADGQRLGMNYSDPGMAWKSARKFVTNEFKA